MSWKSSSSDWSSCGRTDKGVEIRGLRRCKYTSEINPDGELLTAGNLTEEGKVLAIRQMGLDMASGKWRVASFVFGELETCPSGSFTTCRQNSTGSQRQVFFKSKRHLKDHLTIHHHRHIHQNRKPSFNGAQFRVQYHGNMNTHLFSNSSYSNRISWSARSRGHVSLATGRVVIGVQTINNEWKDANAHGQN